MAKKKNPLHRLWRRALGKDWLRQEIRLLKIKRLPWRAVCIVLRHDWGEKSAVITTGPLGAHPRERDYCVLGFHRQCGRCHVIQNVPYTVHEKLAAIEDEIRMDLDEWPVVKRVFADNDAITS